MADRNSAAGLSIACATDDGRRSAKTGGNGDAAADGCVNWIAVETHANRGQRLMGLHVGKHEPAAMRFDVQDNRYQPRGPKRMSQSTFVRVNERRPIFARE